MPKNTPTAQPTEKPLLVTYRHDKDYSWGEPNALFLPSASVFDHIAAAARRIYGMDVLHVIGYQGIEFQGISEYAQQIIRYAQRSAVAAILVKEEKPHHADTQEMLTNIAAIRRQIDTNVPAILIKTYGADREDITESRQHLAEQGYHIVAKDWDEIRPILAARAEQLEQERRHMEAMQEAEMLDYAYGKNYLEGDTAETMLGTPDRDHRIIAEYLRCRLLPACAVAEEFDRVLPRAVYSGPSLSSSELHDATVKADAQKIRDFSDMHREAFLEYLHDSAQSNKRNINMGNIAIDTVTRLHIATRGTGYHHAANQFLDHELRSQQTKIMDQSGAGCDKTDKANREIVLGTMYYNVANFETPIAMFVPDYAKIAQKISTFLMQNKICIPIDENGNLIEGA